MCRYFNYNVSLQDRLLHDQVYCFVLVSVSLWLCEHQKNRLRLWLESVA